jgi:hypothetical protein
MREGPCLELVNATTAQFGGRKQETTVPKRREITRLGGKMTRSGNELAANADQPYQKGAIRGRISALEEAYGEIPVNTYRLTPQSSTRMKVSGHSSRGCLRTEGRTTSPNWKTISSAAWPTSALLSQSSAPVSTRLNCPFFDRNVALLMQCTIVRILYGMTTPEMAASAAKGEARIGGYAVGVNKPDWACNHCGHTWK